MRQITASCGHEVTTDEVAWRGAWWWDAGAWCYGSLCESCFAQRGAQRATPAPFFDGLAQEWAECEPGLFSVDTRASDEVRLLECKCTCYERGFADAQKTVNDWYEPDPPVRG